MRSRLMKPPRYYDQRLQNLDPQLAEQVCFQRYLNRPPLDETTWRRLAAGETVAQAKLNLSRRKLG